jgi:RimJ/RimL family protein N-acetyltransferase
VRLGHSIGGLTAPLAARSPTSDSSGASTVNLSPISMSTREKASMLPLHSARLVLRRFNDADLQPFLAYRNDPEVARYQSWSACSLAEATEFIQQQKSGQPGVPGRWLQIAIALENSGLLIGDCAFQVHAKDERQATIGVTLATAYQGRGFAAESLTCLFDYLFRHMRLHRVVADTDPRNTRAWTLLEHLGMRREGHLIQSLWFKGSWADEYVYAVLKEDWLSHAGRSAHPLPKR